MNATTPTRYAERLDREWAQLRTSRRSLAVARTWRSASGDHPLDAVLRQLDDLQDIISATHRDCGAPGTGNEVMARLVVVARHDELACRLIVQRLLPTLLHRMRRYRRFGDPTDPLELTVAAACIAIGTYDVERRPHHIAPALTSDAVFQALRKPLRRMATTEVRRAPARFTTISAVDEASALEDLADVLRQASQAGVDARDVALFRDLAAIGSPSVLAAQREVTPRTIRNHRDRAAANIRLAIGLPVAA